MTFCASLLIKKIAVEFLLSSRRQLFDNFSVLVNISDYYLHKGTGRLQKKLAPDFYEDGCKQSGLGTEKVD